jgi:hypothetical protein
MLLSIAVLERPIACSPNLLAEPCQPCRIRSCRVHINLHLHFVCRESFRRGFSAHSVGEVLAEYPVRNADAKVKIDRSEDQWE